MQGSTLKVHCKYVGFSVFRNWHKKGKGALLQVTRNLFRVLIGHFRHFLFSDSQENLKQTKIRFEAMGRVAKCNSG